MKTYTEEYLELLSRKFPTIGSVSREIIKLTGKLQLPKEREHFISDIHGEYEAFSFITKGGSGTINKLINATFGATLTDRYKNDLWLIINYPVKMTKKLIKAHEQDNGWLKQIIIDLIRLFHFISETYTRHEIRSFFPQEYSALLEELLADRRSGFCENTYFNSLLDAVVATDTALEIIKALSSSIQRGAVDRLHVIGDIFDRGMFPHKIMDDLIDYKRVDIQWGNHDILWMGAAAGSEACIANVIRICLKYGNLEVLEEGYGINLMSLISFALDLYGDDPAALFISEDDRFSENEKRIMALMHKAISIIQFKYEGQIMKMRPQYEMGDRLVLEYIDYEKGCIVLNGREYPLKESNFPTICPSAPYTLSAEELNVMEKLKSSFVNSAKLQKHVRFLFAEGSIYKAHNGNLLYHGCISMTQGGEFRDFIVDGEGFSGKAFMDRLDRIARQGYFSEDPVAKKYGEDTMWYLWCGNQSPLYGKNKMTTFERYFISDPDTHREERNPYYEFRNTPEVIKHILTEFGLDPERGIIVNGHVPVKVIKGEKPVKAGGRLLVIDGGFSKAYQKVTGIAGYTLVYDAHKLMLVEHRPFESADEIIESATAHVPEFYIIKEYDEPKKIAETDEGAAIQEAMDELYALLDAYRTGVVKEKTHIF